MPMRGVHVAILCEPFNMFPFIRLGAFHLRETTLAFILSSLFVAVIVTCSFILKHTTHMPVGHS